GEQVVLDAVRAFRDQGRTVVVVAHRASLVRAADDVVEVRSARLDPSPGSPGADPADPQDSALAVGAASTTPEGSVP
ncbi:thiol reductant ABC exporter subunit CydD, partial [Cellulosimicrobium cellulans]|nr:thiol reductant ABC exporter subunit CydD [Cellulosimicrobium cellulans]